MALNIPTREAKPSLHAVLDTLPAAPAKRPRGRPAKPYDPDALEKRRLAEAAKRKDNRDAALAANPFIHATKGGLRADGKLKDPARATLSGTLLHKLDQVRLLPPEPTGVLWAKTAPKNALFKAICGWFDHNSERLLAFEDGRQDMILSGDERVQHWSDGRSRIKGVNRIKFLQALKLEQADLEFGPGVYYDQEHDGAVLPMSRDQAYLEAKRNETMKKDPITGLQRVVKFPPDVHPRMKVSDFPIMLVERYYGIWRGNNITPVQALMEFAQRWEQHTEDAEALAEIILDRLTDGETLLDLSSSYGVAMADMKRFINRAHRAVPNFRERFHQALDDGLEAFLMECIMTMTTMIGAVRDKEDIQLINAEKALWKEISDARKWLVQASKFSAYYVGPARSNMLGGEGAPQPTIVLNFAAPAAVPLAQRVD